MRFLLPLWYRLVRFGFRLLYNEFAFTYDWVSTIVSMGAWRCWGRAALPHLHAIPGDRVLEIAHGTGNIHLDLHEAGYVAFGVDLSRSMGRITRRKLVKAGYPLRLTRALAQALPYPDRSFAAVISTFPADFIAAPETLREVHRVLRPGGRFVIVPNAVFTSESASAKGLEALYRITGQRDDSPRAEPTAAADAFITGFAHAGFSVTLLQESCPRSLVTVIVAEKVAEPTKRG
ncbi:MAG: methyltransferase domain-containing protein [Anaerolineae bacterium]